MSREPVSKVSLDLSEERLQQLHELFPEVFHEGKIDFDALKATLGAEIPDPKSERYSFTWAGKRDAMRLAQTPSRATLIPDFEESVNWDTTNNVFIEGDNLEVLKLIGRSYFGRVKMIYIDPPYNTGNDFVYPDNYTDPLQTYLQMTGQVDENGNHLSNNTESNGRYHSAWLSMMYPRLLLARQFLEDEGVIFVSIDDNEVYDLRMMMNEVFGEENFVAQLVWEKGRKNDAKLFSVGHEYMVVYARSTTTLREHGIVWREEKPGAQEIQEEYLRLRAIYGSNNAAVEADLRKFYATLPKNHPAKKHARYGNVDDRGVWRDHDISWPGGGGPTYDVIHPLTKKPCAVPEGGWRYATLEKMLQKIDEGVVVFRADDSEPPIRKTYLVRSIQPNGEEYSDDDANDIGIQVMGSYLYKSAQPAAVALSSLFGGKVFDNPKDSEVVARMIRYCTKPDDIILDYFAGSGTTAEAILSLNHDSGTRKFILVQIPEQLQKNSLAYKLGYSTISRLAITRVQKVIEKYHNQRSGKLFPDERATPEDLGFRVFKLAPSNYRQWHQTEDTNEIMQQLELMAQSLLVDGWKPEDVIFEVALKEGYSLNAQITPVEGIDGNTVYRVIDPDKAQTFHICLDERLSDDLLIRLGLKPDDLFICLDGALNDTLAANFALQSRLKTL